MRNYECPPQMDYPHNYALRIMNLFHILGAKNVMFITLFAPKV